MKVLLRNPERKQPVKSLWLLIRIFEYSISGNSTLLSFSALGDAAAWNTVSNAVGCGKGSTDISEEDLQKLINIPQLLRPSSLLA
jgi:hypothetical protein